MQMAENSKIGKLQNDASSKNLKIRQCENVAEKFESRTIPKKGRDKKIKNFKTRKCAIWRIRES